MGFQVRAVESEADREGLQAFRMRVLVEESDLDGYQLRSRQALFDRTDPHTRSYGLYDDEDIVGSLSCTPLDAVPDPAELTLRYQLEPAIERFGAGAIMVTDGLMVAPGLRGEQAMLPLLWVGFDEARKRGTRLVYGDCSPHLLPLYEQIGYRRYGGSYNDSALGYKVPVLLLLGDHRHLVEARSPLEALVPEAEDDAEARDWFAQRYPEAVLPLTAGFLGPEAFWERLTECIARDPLHHAALWQDMAPEEVQELLRTASIIPVRSGDFLIRKGDRESTVYVLLNGIAEVTMDPGYGRPLSILGAGDTIGEIGFLRDVPRTADVVARTDAEVLVISGDVLERLLEDKPRIAAKLMLNLARELAARLTLTSERLYEDQRRL